MSHAKLQKKSISDRAERELRQKKEAQQMLDKYAVQLHKQQPVIKKSLYQLYVEVSACRNAPDINFAINNIQLKGEEYIEKAENALNRYSNYVPSIGYDYHNNAWYGYKNPDCSFQAKMQLREDFTSISSLCRDLQQNAYTILTNYNIKADSLDSARVYYQFFALAKFSEIITPQLLSSNTVKPVLEALNAMQALTNEMNTYKKALEMYFDNDVYQLNGEQLHKKLTRQFGSGLSRIFNKEYKKIISDIRLCKKDGKAIKYNAALKILDTLRNYQLNVRSFSELESAIIGYLGSGYRGIDTDFAACINELNYLKDLLASNVDLGRLTSMTREEFQCEKVFFASIAFRYEQSFDNSSNAFKRLESSFDATAFNLNNVPLQLLIDKSTICQQNIDNLDNWCEFLKLINALTELELREFVDYCISEQIAAEYLVACYKKTFYMQWVDAVLHVSPILMELARVPHDDTVSRFKEKDKLHFEINKAKIKAELSAQRPNLNMITPGSSIAILKREGEKKRKQKVIRTLLYELGELTQTLKPCFLMSPLSVSTYLNSDMKFDVVVFDEASQIFPQDAVGAIYRAKQLIVVGDSKQMPPSNFFNAVAEIDNDDEDEDIKDFESILDMCSTTLPQRRLKWHYRSRCERLIAFSNKNFYDNDLITFPSSKKDVNGVGVDYIYVNGTFDRKSKTNQAEAEKIVDMVFENVKVYPNRSLGVVAFSVAQQSLIDHLISKRKQQNPIFEEFFKSERFEPFFVKNLETVQGDERDTIIFSIAYAKDSQGRLLMNFGPINREGGERRLNVAVTRAKLNVQLVSSMHCYDIDLTRTQSHGARLLREYLDYAENGTVALGRTLNINAYEQFDSEFEMEVCEFLQNKGYIVDTQVGCSSFKIDLALKLPDSSDYVLAIECDGAAYHSSKTARDRDRLRQDILENMGWKFYRIWSTDWFRNKKVEKERLLTAVKDALLKHNSFKESPITFNSETDEQPITFESIAVDKPFTFPPYIMADEVAIGKKLHYDIPRVVLEIMKIEIAISQDWLLKRICYMFGREKVTSVVIREFDSLMPKLNKLGIVRRNGILLLQGAEMPSLRVPQDNAIPREVRYIPIAELASGITELLKLNVTANKTGLFKLLAKELGFTRMGDVITVCMENALKTLSAVIEVNGDMISLRN